MITARSTLIDVAFEVCTALDLAGVGAVLVGGSAASYYARKYRSLDADFVLTFGKDAVDIGQIMHGLGYREKGSQFAHETSKFTVDFPTGPLAIGRMLVQHWVTDRRGAQVLYVIDRTDSVCDRLAAFYHWNDRNSLLAAALVAKSGPFELERIRRWSEEEGAIVKFQDFVDLLSKE